MNKTTSQINKQIKNKNKAIAEKQKQLQLLEKELAELKECINLDQEEQNIINLIFDYNIKTEALRIPTRLGLIKNDGKNSEYETLKANIQIFPVNAEDWFPTRDEIIIEAWNPSDTGY